MRVAVTCEDTSDNKTRAVTQLTAETGADTFHLGMIVADLIELGLMYEIGYEGSAFTLTFRLASVQDRRNSGAL